MNKDCKLKVISFSVILKMTTGAIRIAEENDFTIWAPNKIEGVVLDAMMNAIEVEPTYKDVNSPEGSYYWYRLNSSTVMIPDILFGLFIPNEGDSFEGYLYRINESV